MLSVEQSSDAPQTSTPEGLPAPRPSHRELAYGSPQERLAAITAESQLSVAARTPTPVESFGLSIASTASAIVLGGVVLIVVADAVHLVHGVNIWPLVTLAVALGAIALVAIVLGSRVRAHELLKTATTPWTSSARLEQIDAKLDELLRREAGTRQDAENRT
ncbi:MAG TPA: hypothetical protein VGF91_01385 [Solirubrobacteraceae bacterium]|jgi:hypothetical protein